MKKTSSDNLNQLLNVEYIQERLDAGYKYTEQATDRDLVLVIGNTGVGKSTTCNYLLGHPMKAAKYNGKAVVETVQETDLQIGHTISSETLYAKSVPLNEDFQIQNGNVCNNICLVDCPGFLGNRTREDSVIESISTELSIRSAREIKGVLILISYPSFQDPRLTEIRQLITTLISLFKDPVEMVQHSIFIITKKYAGMPDEQAREETVGSLNALSGHCKQRAIWLHENQHVTSSDGLTYIEYEKIATYFLAVLKRQEDIIFFNPLDNGECRKLILERIMGIKPRKRYWKKLTDAAKKSAGVDTDPTVRPITIDDFNFAQYDAHRIEFNKVLYDRAHDGCKLINEVCECNEMNCNLAIKITEHQERVASLNKLVLNLKEDKSDREKGYNQNATKNADSIAILESIIVGNDKAIKLKQSKMKDIDAQQEKLREEMETVTNENPLIFRKKSVFRYVHWLNWFGWEEMKFSANTDDTAIPIIRVDKTLKNGKWYDEVDNRLKGTYAVTYKSCYCARPAEASVTAYIRTKDEPGNKIRIKQINEERESLTQKKKVFESEIMDLNKKNQTVDVTIKQAKSTKEEYENYLNQSLIEYEEEIQSCNSQIIQMQKDKEQTIVLGLEKLQEFDISIPKFEILIKIAGLLKFPSSLIQIFISQYKKFLSEKEEYNFGESNAIPDFSVSKKENEKDLGLKDPITGNVIRNLVVTSAGTPFDESSLLKQFEDTKEDFTFTRKDGRIEVIKYFRWKKIPDIQSYLDRQLNDKFSSQSSSMPSFIQPHIIRMDESQLTIKRDTLLQEIDAINVQIEASNAQLEIKKTELDKIYRRLEHMKSKSENKDMISTTMDYQVTDFNQLNVELGSGQGPTDQPQADILSPTVSTTGISNGEKEDNIEETANTVLDDFVLVEDESAH